MSRIVYVVVALFVMVVCVSSVFANIRVEQSKRGGSGLQNVYNNVVCVDGLKVFQTIVFAFKEEGGSSVSNIQLMEEKNGIIVPVRCSR